MSLPKKWGFSQSERSSCSHLLPVFSLIPSPEYLAPLTPRSKQVLLSHRFSQLNHIKHSLTHCPSSPHKTCSPEQWSLRPRLQVLLKEAPRGWVLLPRSFSPRYCSGQTPWLQHSVPSNAFPPSPLRELSGVNRLSRGAGLGEPWGSRGRRPVSAALAGTRTRGRPLGWVGTPRASPVRACGRGAEPLGRVPRAGKPPTAQCKFSPYDNKLIVIIS